MPRAAKRKSTRRSPREITRLKGELVRLVRETGQPDSKCAIAVGVPAYWVGQHKKSDPSFKEDMLKARMNIRPAADWQTSFINARRKGLTRVEAFRAVKTSHAELTPSLVEKEIEENASFRAQIEDLEVMASWEVQDNLASRARTSASDARLYLSRTKGELLPKMPDGSPQQTADKAKGEALKDLGSDWIDPEVESAEVEWFGKKPYGRKRLTDGDHLRRLNDPMPGGDPN